MTLTELFFYSAAIGGVSFVAQVALQLIGAGGGDADAHVDAGGDHHTSPDLTFKVLSLQGLTAFFSMFGLVGLAMHRGSQAGVAASLLGAVAAGVVITWILARIFAVAARLQSSGTLDMHHALGERGTVYLGISKDKPGKVTVIVRGRLLTVDALTEGEPLETGADVTVTRVLSDGSVVVAKGSVML